MKPLVCLGGTFLPSPFSHSCKHAGRKRRHCNISFLLRAADGQGWNRSSHPSWPFLHTQVSVPKGRCFHVSPSLLHVGEELWNGGGGKGCFIVELGPALCSAEEVHIPPPQPFSTLACGCRRKGETLLLHAGEGMRRGNSSPIFLCLQWLTRKGWETLPYKNCFKSIVFLVFCFAKMDSVN